MKLQEIDPIGILGTVSWAQALLNLEQIQMTKRLILFTKAFLLAREEFVLSFAT